MQNKPNLLDTQMNVTSLITVDYENKSNWKLGKNKPNTNPIKPNFRKAKMFLNFYSTKDYENKPRLRTPQKQTQFIPTEGGSNPISPKIRKPLDSCFRRNDIFKVSQLFALRFWLLAVILRICPAVVAKIT